MYSRKSTWHGVQRLASENVCETTQRGQYQDGRKTNEMALSARRGDAFKAAGEEHKTGKRSKINSNTADHIPEDGVSNLAV